MNRLVRGQGPLAGSRALTTALAAVAVGSAAGCGVQAQDAPVVVSTATTPSGTPSLQTDLCPAPEASPSATVTSGAAPSRSPEDPPVGCESTRPAPGRSSDATASP